MKRFVLLFFLTVLSTSIMAAEPNVTSWRWYYTAFESPEPTAGIFVRSGQALLERDKGTLEIRLRDKANPDLAPKYSGQQVQNHVRGRLKGFFMHQEDLLLFGEYRSRKLGGSCSLEEIVLRPPIPDGSLFVMTRVLGSCQ
jgi:hypothetical protein